MLVTYEERRKIENLYLAEKTVKEIADAIGKDISTVYRELRRGDTGQLDRNCNPQYSAELAQKRTRRPGRPRVLKLQDPTL